MIRAALPTRTEIQAAERQRQFRKKIRALADDLRKSREAEPPKAIEPEVLPRAIAPEAMPAEPDPPRDRPVLCAHCSSAIGGPVTLHHIKVAVANEFGITYDELSSPRRSAEQVLPRQVAMWLCRRLLPRKSLVAIGMAFRRDHTVVLHADRRVPDLLAQNLELADRVEKLRLALGGQP